MRQLILFIGLFILNNNISQAQDFKNQLIGRWEDEASTNENSFQWYVEPEKEIEIEKKKGKKTIKEKIKVQRFAFLNIPQSKLTDSIAIPEDKLYNYRWLSNNILTYAKLPDRDPVKAQTLPPTHTILRIDELTDNKLKISFSDHDWSKQQLDSILKDSMVNFNKYIGKRTAQYKKLDFEKEKNKAFLLGLWRDEKSTKNTALQFYVQKTVCAFLKLDTAEQKLPTTIKTDKGYEYRWITSNIFYYFPQDAVGLTPRDIGPNKYQLMRIDELDRKKLVVTLGMRPFNKEGLKFVIEENDFDQYFGTDKVVYERIPIIEENCEGTEVVKIGNKDVIVKKKPIIYLYPEKEQEVNVKVHFQGELTHTYPKYNPTTGWTVKASPNGDLIDTITKREYYALYWEGENNLPYTTDKGFVIKGEESAAFLEEKCAQLGLSAREANEFIIYWLPQLEKNTYNFIHFSTQEYQDQAPMEITPQPDAVIRVFMLFKGLDKFENVEPQIFPETPVRKGFTVIEWGGAELTLDDF